MLFSKIPTEILLVDLFSGKLLISQLLVTYCVALSSVHIFVNIHSTLYIGPINIWSIILPSPPQRYSGDPDVILKKWNLQILIYKPSTYCIMDKNVDQELSGVSTSLRIPPIWRDRIRLWFAQFEAVMASQKKGDQAMYELVIGQLERQDLDEISDIILRPPENHRYEALKSRLFQVYEESEQRQVQRLLSEMELGDLKPSQLLRRMKSLAADNISDSALRIMWTNHLPQSVRAVLAVSDNIAKHSDIHELAMMADKILEQTQPLGAVAAVSSVPATAHVPTSIEEKIDALTKEIAELKATRSNYQRRRPFNRQRSRSRSSSKHNQHRTSNDQSAICFYHRKFGKEARRCTRPCSYVDSGALSGN